tara:strand:- start:72 stop:245 length:174 start_codon:yes stop_codon:yes gene_type:complete
MNALSKKRSSKELLTIHMKFALFVVIAILFWNSDGARQFTAESFNTLADVVQPDNNY